MNKPELKAIDGNFSHCIHIAKTDNAFVGRLMTYIVPQLGISIADVRITKCITESLGIHVTLTTYEPFDYLTYVFVEAMINDYAEQSDTPTNI